MSTQPSYRAAGIFLLLTALATAISVPARLAADADATPLTDALAQAQTIASAEIARLEVSEKLAAIGSASVAYGTGGAARLIGGLTLLAAGFYLVEGNGRGISTGDGCGVRLARCVRHRFGGVRRIGHRAGRDGP